MATTTNYGWTTPDDTALVKDGASAIRTLGSSVDTTTKNLNPSTTLGDIEYRSSTANTNTRVGIGSSGQALTVVAGVPSWAASPTSVLTTTGDTLYASAANTLARLGIGSTGQVLTVSGGVPTWAAAGGGSMTQLATGTLSGAAVTLSSIAQTYNTLYLLITGVTGNTSNAQIKILPNNASTWCGSITQDATVTSYTNEDIITLSATLRTNANNVFSLVIKNYASTTSYKPITGEGLYVNGGSTVLGFGVTGSLATNTAISSLVINYGGTNTFAGGTYILYGVN